MKTTIRARLMAWRQRVADGDQTTRKECHLEFGDHVLRIVRHMVRTRDCYSELGVYVQATMGRLQESLQLERIDLIREVTAQVCAVMAGVGVVPQAETIRVSNEATIVGGNPVLR